MADGTHRTYVRGERLLGKLRLGYSIAAACKAEGIARSTYYEWIKEEPFKSLVLDALEDGTDKIEDVARSRALEGDHAMITLILRARRPDKYRERADLNLSGDLTQRVELIGISEDDV